jgi:alkylresorcinol/alkylpyrone synthase
VVGIGSAFPPAYRQDELWSDFFAVHYEHDGIAERIWHGCGVDRRHAVVDPRVDDLRFAATQDRMRRFRSAGAPLAVEAVERCLDDAGLRADDVGQLTVVSCTGYGAPGVEVDVARAIGLDRRVQRLHVRDMGCYAAIPALAATADAAAARGKVGVVLCLELTSLHVQPPSDDRGQVVAHALFSDAAVAVAVVPGSQAGAGVSTRAGERSVAAAWTGLEVLDVACFTSVEDSPLMRWDVTELGFRMGLSPKVPRVLERHVREVVDDLLAANGLAVEDVRGWAVHPGGPAILDVIEQRLGLSTPDLAESRQVLAEHGNCSSSTVLLVLDRIRRRDNLRDGDAIVAMAFGPGLTLYATLLRFSRARPRTARN